MIESIFEMHMLNMTVHTLGSTKFIYIAHFVISSCQVKKISPDLCIFRFHIGSHGLRHVLLVGLACVKRTEAFEHAFVLESRVRFSLTEKLWAKPISIYEKYRNAQDLCKSLKPCVHVYSPHVKVKQPCMYIK